MTAIARRRIRVREPFDPVLSFCAGVGNLACWFAGRIPERIIERYSGMVGEEKAGNCTYDQLTPQQHDEMGAWWSSFWNED